MRPPSPTSSAEQSRHRVRPRRVRAPGADQPRTWWDVVAGVAEKDDATISAANYAEVLQTSRRRGVGVEAVDALLDELGPTVTPVGRLDARLAASSYRHGSNRSFADCVCLALARSLSSAAYTADSGGVREPRGRRA